MAIAINMTTAHGINLPGAYLKVTFFSGDSTYVSYHVKTWATEQARRDELQVLDEKNYSFEYAPGMGDILPACYADLMARPEFAGATAA